MTFLESVPKYFLGGILLDPAGEYQGEYIVGSCDEEWFTNNFPDIANAQVPLSDDLYNQLHSIDKYWAINAERWRKDGLI